MAPRIIKKVEVMFIALIVVIFVLIINNYTGFEAYFSKSISSILKSKKDKDNTEAVYLGYEKEAQELRLNDEDNQNQTDKFAKSIPILVYHGIVEKPNDNNNEEISIDTFKQQMFLLKKSGYNTITMEDFYEFIKNNKQLPEKSFMITFDDGRKDSYYNSDPILAALGYKAVMFIITNNFDKNSRYYLSNMELKNMLDTKRWEIDSHGRNDHGFIAVDGDNNQGRFLSNKMWINEGRIETDDEYKERILGDLTGSKDDIKRELGVEAKGFALPAGDYGNKVSNFPQAENVIMDVLNDVYPLSFFQFKPDVVYGYYRANFKDFSDNAYFFRRVKVPGSTSPEDLLDIMRASEAKDLPYVEKFDNSENWINGWGEKVIEKDKLTIKSSPNENSAGVYLDGSYLWQNYQFSASVALVSGKNYSLEALASNGKMFVGCSYFNNQIRAYKATDGNKKELNSVTINNFKIKSNNKVSIAVEKDYFSCNLNDKIRLKTFFDYPVKNGGVAIKTFSEEPGVEAQIDVSDILVSENK